MKRGMTRRRSALCWTALAAALILLWGVAKGYGFTPGQAREQHLGTPTPETVLVLGRELHPYTTILDGPDYERHVLCADEERMYLLEEVFKLFGNGWQARLESRVELGEENAQSFPQLKVWAGHHYSWSGNGYLYFRVEDMSDEVLGFAAVRRLKSPHAGEPPAVDFTAGGRLKADGSLLREELTAGGKGGYYGVIAYYPEDVFHYPDQCGEYEWYIEIRLTGGRTLLAEARNG